MAVTFNRWTLLSIIEVIMTSACLIFKKVTDDEASRLFFYLQKISREWSLLNNVTWDRVGSAAADATYGGYIIITFALLVGRLLGEFPTRKRITEFILLGVGALLFIVLGSLEFAALDSVPENLVDNAAIIGTLTLATAALFLLDMGGPKGRKPMTKPVVTSKSVSKPTMEARRAPAFVYDIERELERAAVRERDAVDEARPKKNTEVPTSHAMTNTTNGVKHEKPPKESRLVQNGYKKMKNDKPKHFGIYGKDIDDDKSESETDVAEDTLRSMQEHSPVWSKIRKGRPLVDYVDTSRSPSKLSHSILNQQL